MKMNDVSSVTQKQTRRTTKMKMNEVKSVTWTKLAEVKTSAKTLMGIYKVLCREFGVDFYEDIFAVADAIKEGYIQVCDDGLIVWMS